MHIWLNGSVEEAAHAHLPAHSAGTLLGWGAFTTLGVWSGRPFALVQHLRRLRHNAAELGLELAFTDYELDCALYDVIEANNVREGLARLTVTARGDGRWNSAPGSDVSVLAQQHSTTHAPFRPLTLGLSPFRVGVSHALSGLKSTSYAAHLRAWHTAQRAGWDEAVLLNDAKILCETTRANLFWIKEDVVFTPSLECGPLPGIARERVLAWCSHLGIVAREGSYLLSDLHAAEEVFVTASTTGPRPVARLVEGTDRSLEAPGPLTQQLMARWEAAVRDGE